MPNILADSMTVRYDYTLCIEKGSLIQSFVKWQKILCGILGSVSLVVSKASVLFTSAEFCGQSVHICFQVWFHN